MWTYAREVVPVEAAVDEAEVAPCDPVDAAFEELPTQEVEVPAWMVTGADPMVEPVESVIPKVTPVPAGRFTVQVSEVALVPETRVSRGVAPSWDAGKTRIVY